MGIKRLICSLSLLLLFSCASKQEDFAPLPAITRIEAKTMRPRPSYGEAKKTFSNAGQIARIVAAVDAEKSGWQTVPDGPQGSGKAIDLSFYVGGSEVRRLTVFPRVIVGSSGNEWNLSAIDTSGGVGAGSNARTVVKLVPDAQIKTLLADIGPMFPPKLKPKK